MSHAVAPMKGPVIEQTGSQGFQQRSCGCLCIGCHGNGGPSFYLTHPCSEYLCSWPYLPFQDLYSLLVNVLTGFQSLCGLQLGLMEPLSLSCQVPLVLGS